MRVVFAGTPEVALPALAAVAASPHELVGVVTRPDAPSGRGRSLTPSPVARAAVAVTGFSFAAALFGAVATVWSSTTAVGAAFRNDSMALRHDALRV